MDLTIKEKVIIAARKKVLFLPHAIKQMSRPERMISPNQVIETVLKGDVIEAYLNDPRGESCLILYLTIAKARPIHVVCSPKPEYLAIITAYIPQADQWNKDYTMRKH